MTRPAIVFPFAATAAGCSPVASAHAEQTLAVRAMSKGMQHAIDSTHTGHFSARPLVQAKIWEQFPNSPGLSRLVDSASERMAVDVVPARQLSQGNQAVHRWISAQNRVDQ